MNYKNIIENIDRAFPILEHNLKLYKIILTEKTRSQLKTTTLKIFILDDIFDKNNDISLESINWERGHLENYEFDNLISNYAIENKLSKKEGLIKYLEISSKTIGINLLVAVIADSYGIKLNNWVRCSNFILFNSFILRIANDYLDYKKDFARLNEENEQIKLRSFITSTHLTKIFLIILVYIHKSTSSIILLFSSYNKDINRIFKATLAIYKWAILFHHNKEDSGR